MVLSVGGFFCKTSNVLILPLIIIHTRILVILVLLEFHKAIKSYYFMAIVFQMVAIWFHRKIAWRVRLALFQLFCLHLPCFNSKWIALFYVVLTDFCIPFRIGSYIHEVHCHWYWKLHSRSCSVGTLKNKYMSSSDKDSSDNI